MRLFFSVLDYVEVTFFCFFSLINSSNGITATDRNASTENASKNDASFACWSNSLYNDPLAFFAARTDG